MLKREIHAIQVAERKKAKAKMVTKGTIDQLLVEERKKSRASHRLSRFKQRTLAIYNGQVRRALELHRIISFTLEEFRERVQQQLNNPCPYCSTRLTVNNFVDDHPWSISRGGPFTLDNTAACCKPCNMRKGILNKEEFDWLSTALKKNLPPEAVTDVWRRLTLGGKWAGNMMR